MTENVKNQKNPATMLILTALFGLLTAGAYFWSASELKKDVYNNNLVKFKELNCKKVGEIDAAHLLLNRQYQYKCDDGVVYTTNHKYDLK